IDRGIARDVDHDRAAPLARRAGERAEQCFGQTKRAHEIDGERKLELFALADTACEERELAPSGNALVKRNGPTRLTESASSSSSPSPIRHAKSSSLRSPSMLWSNETGPRD